MALIYTREGDDRQFFLVEQTKKGLIYLHAEDGEEVGPLTIGELNELFVPA
jgi:hypothetical protein